MLLFVVKSTSQILRESVAKNFKRNDLQSRALRLADSVGCQRKDPAACTQSMYVPRTPQGHQYICWVARVVAQCGEARSTHESTLHH